jgi:hypothetical protein
MGALSVLYINGNLDAKGFDSIHLIVPIGNLVIPHFSASLRLRSRLTLHLYCTTLAGLDPVGTSGVRSASGEKLDAHTGQMERSGGSGAVASKNEALCGVQMYGCIDIRSRADAVMRGWAGARHSTYM